MKKYILLLSMLFTLSFSAMAQIADQNTLRLVTYNVRNGIGMDNKMDLDRVALAILKTNPDVVALQEVDSVTNRTGKMNIPAELGKKTGMHAIFAKAIPYETGGYGIGLLSREKPLSYFSRPLPGREETRVLLIAEFEQYIICNAHFSLNEEDRLASIPIIVETIKGYDKPVYFTGDLNARPDSPVIGKLKQNFTILSNSAKSTFPADQPRVCLDYILRYPKESGGYTIKESLVVNEPMASDHRPVLVKVRNQTPRDKIFRTNPYLQNPTDNGITVSWLTHVPVYSWVEYGTDTLHLQKAHTLVDGQVISNNFKHKIRLSGLEPGQRYYYRICSREILSYKAYSKTFGETAVSPIYSFRLPDHHSTEFTALIFNDIHKHYKTLDTLMARVAETAYDFVIFNGDMVDDPANEREAVTTISYYNDQVHAQEKPVFYLRGNHEIRNAYSIELRDLFDYVGDKTYGAFNWGDTRFVLLDCGEDKPDDHWVYYGLNDFTQLRQDQVDFLKKETSSRAFKKASKRVLVHHIPVYGNDDKYNPCLDLWNPVLSKAPFHIAINGHTHRYAYHPAGTIGNPFPVMIGGGPSLKSATVAILTKKGKDLYLKVLDASGELLLDEKY